MRAIFACSSLVLCLIAGCSNSNPVPPNIADWAVHEEGNLKVKLPFKPTLKSQTVQVPVMGQLNVKMYLCEITRKSGLMVSQIKYPLPPSDYDVSAGLKGAVSEMAKSTNSTIQSDKSIDLKSIPGRELVMTAENGYVVKAKIFIDGKGPTMYQFQAVGNDAFLKSKAVASFFDSIELTPIADPKK